MKNLQNFDPKKIIVRMPNWIGDLVMATPILTDLRKRYPDAEITAMAKTPLCELLKEDRDINELFCFSKLKNDFNRRQQKRNIIQKLRTGKYDLGILLTNSFSSAWWFWQGKIENRLGFSCNFRRLFLTHPVPAPENKENRHLVETYKMLLRPLGMGISETLPRLFVTEDECKEAKEILYQRGYKEGKTLIGINAGAAYGSAKCWPAERFCQVAKKLLENENFYVAFFGDAATRDLVNEICGNLNERAIDLAGATSIRELLCIIKQCDVLLTNDSGPMHIGAAFQVPLVALFGSTNQVATGPYKTGFVIDKKVECSPCYKRFCPIDFRCMKLIEVDEVYEKILELIRIKSRV